MLNLFLQSLMIFVLYATLLELLVQILAIQKIRIISYQLSFLTLKGNPKGVILTHANFIADMAGAEVAGIDTYPTDVHISYLPLAHVFERIVFHKILSSGGACGFFRGNPKLLFEDMIVRF